MSSFCFESYDSMSQYLLNWLSCIKDLLWWNEKKDNVIEVEQDEEVFMRPLTPIPSAGILSQPVFQRGITPAVCSIRKKPELYTIPEDKTIVRSNKDHVVLDMPELYWDNNIKWVDSTTDKLKKD
jgi:hypothetical protein